MEDMYFVTQAISPEAVHVAVSEKSDPVVIATTRRHTLYQGANRGIARQVAENLRVGRLVTYKQDEINYISRYCQEWRNGEAQEDRSDFWASNRLRPIIENLETGIPPMGRISFFGEFSPEELEYLEAVGKESRERSAAIA